MKRIGFVAFNLWVLMMYPVQAGIWGEDVYFEDLAEHLGYGFRKIPPTDFFHDEAFVEGDVGKGISEFEIKKIPGGFTISMIMGDTYFQATAMPDQENVVFENRDGSFFKLKYKRALGVLPLEVFEAQLKTALGVSS